MYAFGAEGGKCDEVRPDFGLTDGFRRHASGMV
jgi:hypothetical protein